MLVLLLMYAGLVGGGNDLLDYASTDAYWKARDVPVTVGAMRGELRPADPAAVAAWVGHLGSADRDVRSRAAEQLRAAGDEALPALRAATKGAAAAGGFDPQRAEAAGRAGELAARIAATPRAKAVRRLMAMRALGELGDRAAVPDLQPLTHSTEPFVADYAAAAIASIEGRPGPRPRPADVGKDVWLLPAGVRAVGRYVPMVGRPLLPDEAVRAVGGGRPAAPAGDAAVQPADSPEVVTAAAVTQRVIELAEQVGNVRLDALTVGASGDLGEASGYVVAVARVKYDRPAVLAFLAAQRVPSAAMAGTTVYRFGPESAVFFPADDRVVLVASPRGKSLPVEEMVAAITKGAGGLAQEAGMAKLLQAADTGQPLWVVAEPTDAYRRAVPQLPAVSALTFVGRLSAPDTIEFRLAGSGPDRAKLKAVAEELVAGVRQAMPAGKEAGGAGVDPLVGLSTALLRSVRVEATADGVAVVGSVKTPRADLAAILLRAGAMATGSAGDDAGRR